MIADLPVLSSITEIEAQINETLRDEQGARMKLAVLLSQARDQFEAGAMPEYKSFSQYLEYRWEPSISPSYGTRMANWGTFLLHAHDAPWVPQSESQVRHLGKVPPEKAELICRQIHDHSNGNPNEYDIKAVAEQFYPKNAAYSDEWAEKQTAKRWKGRVKVACDKFADLGDPEAFYALFGNDLPPSWLQAFKWLHRLAKLRGEV